MLSVRGERSCPDRSCDPVAPLITSRAVMIVGVELPERARSNASEARMIATTLAAGLIFACTPVRVWDGDGPIWCAEGPKVRLAGIAAREMDGSCRPGHPCPSAPAVAARDRLVRLLGGGRGRAPEGHVLVRGPTLRCLSGLGGWRSNCGLVLVASHGRPVLRHCSNRRGAPLEALLARPPMLAQFRRALSAFVSRASLTACAIGTA